MAVAALAVTASDAFASHFRYGTITWTVANPATPNVVTIRFDSAWGLSQWPPPRPTSVGQVVATGNLGQLAIRRGDVGFAFVPIHLTVTAINSAEDWFAASFATTVTLPATTATYTATFTGCCRISTLRDGNADADYFIRSDITVKMPPGPVNQPPTSATVPIITLANGRPVALQLHGSDPNGDVVLFEIPSSAHSGLPGPAPSSPASMMPGAFQLTTGGLMRWTPDTNGLYAVQVRLSDPHGASTVVDFLLNVVSAAGESPGVFINDRVQPQTFTAVHGTPISFTVRGTDPENTPVALYSSSLPVGSLMTPSLPLSGINASSTFTWTPAASAVGTYVMSFAAVDGAGLQSTNSVTLIVTNNRPTIDCTSNGPDLEATSAAGALFRVNVNVDDLDGDKLTVRFFVDGEARDIVSLLTPPATQTFSVAAGLGSHTYEVRVDDGLGIRSCAESFAVRDTTAPSITVDPGDQTLAATSRDGAVATFQVTAHDGVDAEPDVVCSHASDATFPIVVTTVACSATDAAGNRNETSFIINVIDPDPPVIDAHADVTAEATRAASATVIYTPPATHDGIDGDGLATCIPASGSTFALDATTTVTCSASDAFGNKAVDVRFTVTVVDTTSPTIEVHGDITASATSAAGAIVNYTSPATHDAVDGTGIATCMPVSGSTFAIGATTITCSAVDARGNPAKDSSFTVTITNQAPTFTPPANLTIEAISAAGTAVTFLANGDDVEQGSLAAECSQTSGSTFPIGTTKVDCTVTDFAGLSASGSFKVTVSDTTAPSITTVEPSTTALWPPNHEMQPVAITVVATDAVTAAPACRIIDVRSNEPNNAGGDGHSDDDWQVTGAFTLQLRAERAGSGGGRIYAITIQCTDGAGNASTSATAVSVSK